jgi:hypothetical protein
MQAFPQLPSWDYSIPHHRIQFPSTPGNTGETSRKRILVGAVNISWLRLSLIVISHFGVLLPRIIQTLNGSVPSERGLHMGIRLTGFKSSQPCWPLHMMKYLKVGEGGDRLCVRYCPRCPLDELVSQAEVGEASTCPTGKEITRLICRGPRRQARCLASETSAAENSCMEPNAFRSGRYLLLNSPRLAELPGTLL